MTQIDFNTQVCVGDIVTIVGVKNRYIPCVVMTKTNYAVNLYTVEQALGEDGVMRPLGSYYRTYDEILARIGEAHGLYNYYISLKSDSQKLGEEEEEYKQWLDKNYKFIRRFIKENIFFKPNRYDDTAIPTIEIIGPKELQQ